MSSAHVEVYEERYRGGYMAFWPPEKRRRVAEVIRGLSLPSEGRALDFGCGVGVFTEDVKAALPGWEVSGTDISQVAVAEARRRLPGLGFFLPHELDRSHPFDFLFTHHVLEHVEELDATWREMSALLGPGGHMLHVLPCGNEGSLEHRICSAIEDGIDRARGNRFYFEDPTHVRRLTTAELERVAGRHGLRLAGASYSNQRAGTLEWVSKMDLSFVLGFADPRRARDRAAAARLWGHRLLFLGLYALRLPALIVERTLRTPEKRLGHYARLAAVAPAVPLSRWVDGAIRSSAETEWRERRGDRSGSEMYLHFVRD